MRNRLIPLTCEWMLSTSTTCIEIRMIEGGDCVVDVDAAYLPDLVSGHQPDGALVIRRIQIRFDGGQWVKTRPPFSGRETIDPDRYDFSAVPFRDIGGLGVSDFVMRFRDTWRESGNCPDPRIYEVYNSEWIREVGADRFGCKHYLLSGTEMVVEVLAMDFIVELAAG